MSDLMRPLHEEHQLLLPYIEELRRTADDVGMIPDGELEVSIEACRMFIFDRLVPHSEIETTVMYPLVARLMGNPHSTDTMKRDHEEIMRLADELEALSNEFHRAKKLDEELAVSFRRVLYGLYAVVGLHFSNEEEVFLPLLSHGLTSEEASSMFRKLEVH